MSINGRRERRERLARVESRVHGQRGICKGGAKMTSSLCRRRDRNCRIRPVSWVPNGGHRGLGYRKWIEGAAGFWCKGDRISLNGFRGVLGKTRGKYRRREKSWN